MNFVFYPVYNFASLVKNQAIIKAWKAFITKYQWKKINIFLDLLKFVG